MPAPGNLPAELSSFVGRRDDLDRCATLLAGTRLLTLTGAGGCGKTRLARRLAARTAERFPDGVWWVELARLADGAQVTDLLARSLGLQPGEVPPLDAVLAHLTAARALVLLDNCEHVLDASAGLAHRLLAGVPGLSVLATSREPLGVEGETTWRVPSLTVPPVGVDPSELRRYEAAELFLARGAQARPGLDVSPATAPAVSQICRRLDGIPLALELAAARVGAVPLERIVAGLDDRFRLLAGRSRVAIARHRTLLASVEWSHDLLAADEQAVLRRLGVFVGGFTVDAAETVACAGTLDAGQVQDALARLVTKSLVQLDEPDGPGRYRLLETIREFALARLDEAGEAQPVGDAHLAWALRFALAHEAGAVRADPQVLDSIETELPNLRAALEHACTGSAPADDGLRLVAALAFFWAQRGYGLEGAARAGRVLTAHPAATPAARARARWSAAYGLFYGGDFDGAVAAAETGRAEARAAGDTGTEGRCVHVLGAAAFLVDPAVSRATFTEALELARTAGDRWCEADALQFLGFNHLTQHRPAEAPDLLAACAAIARAEGNRFQLALDLLGAGLVATAAGDLGTARATIRAGGEAIRRIGDPVIELWCQAGLAHIELTAGRWGELVRIADETGRPGQPLPPVNEEFVGLLRRIADRADRPASAVSDLVAVGELLRTTFVPNEGMRLTLTGAAVAAAAGDAATAREVAEVTLGHAERFGSALAGVARVLLGRLERPVGEPGAAERIAHAGLAEIVEASLWSDVPDALELLGGLALDAGSTAEGTRLLAAGAGLHRRFGEGCLFAADVERDRVRAAAELGPGFDRVWNEGTALDGPAAVAYVRRARGGRKRPTFGWESLTPTEREVVELVAAGLGNPEIGERLFVSRGTVKTHLLHVFAKLGVRSRAELATAATRRNLA